MFHCRVLQQLNLVSDFVYYPTMWRENLSIVVPVAPTPSCLLMNSHLMLCKKSFSHLLSQRERERERERESSFLILHTKIYTARIPTSFWEGQPWKRQCRPSWQWSHCCQWLPWSKRGKPLFGSKRGRWAEILSDMRVLSLARSRAHVHMSPRTI